MPTRRGLAAVALAVLAAIASAARPAALFAQSPPPAPSGSPDPERPPERPAVQVWLDAPPPTDAAPGDEVAIGATLWDTTSGAVADMGATVFIQAIPAAGSGGPSRVTAISDWAGHYRGTVVVPPGGLGALELGVTGTICENDVCRPDDWVFEVAGHGPPPEAPITSLARAMIDVDRDTLTAGRPTDIEIVLVANAEWPSLPRPDLLVVRAREPRGPNLAAASLRLADPAGMAYAGSITIPRAGDLVLEAATDEDGGDATRFGTSMTPVTVLEASGGWSAPAPLVPVEDEGLPLVVLVLLAIVAIAGAGAMLVGFRGGSR